MPSMKKTSHASLSADTNDALYAPPIFSMAAGKKACDALAHELDAIEYAERVTTKIDVEGATYAALGVAGFVASPAVRQRFARLPKEEFRMADLDGLETACFAVLYCLIEARAAGALEGEARLPAALVAEAAEVEARMQALCEYHFADDPQIAPELDRLRPGSGHRDLANDLIGYARIYGMRAAVVKSDPKRYRPTDAARAESLSGAIIQALSAGVTRKGRAAYDRYARAWTRLNQRYSEVRAAGLWLYRGDARLQERFPSLFAASRGTYTASKKAPAREAPEAKAEPSGPELSDGASPA